MANKLTLDEMIELAEVGSGWKETREERQFSYFESYIGMFKELLLIISLDYDNNPESTPIYSITVESNAMDLGTYSTYNEKGKEYKQLSELYHRVSKKYHNEIDEYLIASGGMIVLDNADFAKRKKKLQKEMAAKTNERLDYAKSLLNDFKKNKMKKIKQKNQKFT